MGHADVVRGALVAADHPVWLQCGSSREGTRACDVARFTLWAAAIKINGRTAACILDADDEPGEIGPL